MKRINVLLACVALGSFGLSAYAQDKAPKPADKPAQPADGGQPRRGGPGGPGGGGGQMSAEKSKAAWEAQAASVAKRLGYNDEQTKAVTKAYLEARESYNTASAKAREEAMKKMQEEREKNQDNQDGGRRGAGMAEMQKAMEAVTKAEKEKFEKALPGSLSGDQRSKTIASLGAFNRQWDTLTDTLLGMKLDAEKQQTAMAALEDYSAAVGKLRPSGGAATPPSDADREKMRTEMESARKKLTDSLKAVMTDDQIKKFEESMNRGRGQGGRGGQGGQGGAGRGGAPGGDNGDGAAPAPRRRGGGGGGGGGF